MIINLKAYLYLISLYSLLGCSGKQKAAPAVVTTAVMDTATAVHRRAEVPLSPTPTADRKSVEATRSGQWVYKETIGKSGVKTYTASMTAPEVLDFDAPFNGGSTVTVTLRKRNEETTVSLSVSKGQFTSSFQGGSVRIRFDKDATSLYQFTAASNGSTDIIFLEPVSRLVGKMKAAQKMIVSVGFYSQGTRQLTFKTAGLTWK